MTKTARRFLIALSAGPSPRPVGFAGGQGGWDVMTRGLAREGFVEVVNGLATITPSGLVEAVRNVHKKTEAQRAAARQAYLDRLTPAERAERERSANDPFIAPYPKGFFSKPKKPKQVQPDITWECRAGEDGVVRLYPTLPEAPLRRSKRPHGDLCYCDLCDAAVDSTPQTVEDTPHQDPSDV